MGPGRSRRLLEPLFVKWTWFALLVAVALLCGGADSIPVRAAEGTSSDGDLHVDMGIYYQMWRVPAAARNHFEEAWEKTGGDFEVAVAAAVAAYAGNDYASALQWIKLISDDSTEYPLALCLEGTIYLRQVAAAYTGGVGLRPAGLYTSAEERFLKALSLRDDLAYARHMLARVYAARGESQRALTVLSQIPDAEQIDAVSDLVQALRQR